MYNWYAIADPRGLAPLGWHIPTDEELIQLGNDVNNDGGSIKSNSGWQNGANGTNTSRFYALPGGFRNYNGAFSFLEYFGYWWSSSASNNEYAWGRYLNSEGNYVYRYTYKKGCGLAIRCIKDS